MGRGMQGLLPSHHAPLTRNSWQSPIIGSAFLAEHFHNQIRFWGMTPSYAFVGEPETNGVIERFFRTLKEQIVHGRIYQTIDEVRDAVRDFVARYNAEWLIEKNGLRSPSDARAAWYQPVMRAAA